ncbi:MAG: Ig-like domain-containing protein [Eubacterium sp.]|nr:Ig-like domain-containing protein [Eubacterium sp.]
MKKDDLKKRDTSIRYRNHMILSVLVLLAIISLFYQNSVHATSKIQLNQSRLSMTVGEIRKLNLSGISSKNQKCITWKSSAPGIASVSKKGKVNAKKAGNATITASLKGIKYRCKVQVDSDSDAVADANGNSPKSPEAVTPSTSSYNGFLVDNVYHSKNNGDIHYVFSGRGTKS